MKFLSVMLIFSICWLLNIYGGYLWVHHCWRPTAKMHANVLLCLQLTALPHIMLSLRQCRHCTKTTLLKFIHYCMVLCPWSAILVVYLVNLKLCFVNDFTGCAWLLGFNTDALYLYLEIKYLKVHCSIIRYAMVGINMKKWWPNFMHHRKHTLK